MENMKKVQMYPFIKDLHTIHNSIITSPPEGYVFIGNDTSALYEFRKRISSSKIIRFFYHQFLKIFKTTKIIEATQKSNILDEADLVLSGAVMKDIEKPWVLYMFDHPACLAGNNYELFLKEKEGIEKALLADNCKRIICTNESPIPFMKEYFPEGVTNKIALVRLAIEEREPKNYVPKEKVQILFMGSINNPQDFYIKGGLYVVEAFKKLSKRNDVNLVIRCGVSEDIRKELDGLPNIKIIDQKIPFEEIINLYKDSDILLMPGHNYSVTSFLEGMSFGLPIIALNTYAVQDFVKDGYNGIIVKRSDEIKGYESKAYPTIIRSDEFMADVLKNRDKRVVDDLVKQMESLIINQDKIKELGSNAQKEIAEKYCIGERNKGLKEVFDEALSDSNKQKL